MKRFYGAMLMCATVATAAPSPVRAASSGGDLSLNLRQNVVRVVAAWKNGATYDGFGFIVGERAGTLYVITADHVVRGDGPDAIDRNPKVAFFGDQGAEYSAELLATRLAPAQGDIAILRLPAPAGLAWQRPVIARGRTQRGASVWFVGLLRDWFVPSQPGSVNRVEPNGFIVVEGLNVKVGTSGAPLISEAGIVGMVVADTGIFARATPIDLIERAVKDWGYPWDLTLAAPPQPEPKLVPPPPPPPPPPVHDCDRLAARPDDPLKPAQVAGVLVEQIDVRKALPACLEAVKNYAGTTRFAYQLGRVYQAARNISDATVWYRRAADAGYAPAQVNLGIMYANGRYALARNDAEAVRLYRLAANQGYARGQTRLGYMYEEGRGGLVRDTAEALRLYRLAAAQGNEFARRAIERLHHMERPRYMERHRHRGRW
jgi:tetratricopeptide (TPR) repeat protein